MRCTPCARSSRPRSTRLPDPACCEVVPGRTGAAPRVGAALVVWASCCGGAAPEPGQTAGLFPARVAEPAETARLSPLRLREPRQTAGGSPSAEDLRGTAELRTARVGRPWCAVAGPLLLAPACRTPGRWPLHAFPSVPHSRTPALPHSRTPALPHSRTFALSHFVPHASLRVRARAAPPPLHGPRCRAAPRRAAPQAL